MTKLIFTPILYPIGMKNALYGKSIRKNMMEFSE